MDVHKDDPEDLEALLLAPVGVGAAETVDPARLQDRLRRREAALRAVLEGLPDATVASGRDHRIVFVNAHAEALFGYAQEELLGQPVQVLWPERLRERYTRNMELYFATDHPLRFSTRADGLRSDGTEFVGEMSWGIVETEAGPLLLAIGRDMTAHREALSRVQRQSKQVAAVAALGERALAGADVGDLAAEAVEKLRETMPLTGAFVVRDTVTLAAWGPAAGGAALRFEIRTGDEVFGEVGVVPEHPLNEDQENFLRGVANVLATAMGRLRSDEQMRHEALHDPLTGLANRALCRERLIHALARTGRDDGSACVLFIDLDDFKGVNDLYGHAAGDSLLIALSRRLVATVRPADTVARLGGDEFVVVCEDIDETTAIALGHRLTESIHEPMDVEGVEHRLSASIGIALGAAGRRDPDALLADADAAAYRAKAEGRGRVEVFDTRLRRHARERLRTAAALERALSLGQLRLAFQPIVQLADSAIVGHEALLRWDSPGGVMSAPADFIPVAEESALIVEIGAWTLMQACHETAAAFGVVGRRAGGRREPLAPPARAARPPRAGRRLPALERAAVLGACGWRSRRPCCSARPRPRGATSTTCAGSASCSCSTTSAPATRRCATCRWRRSRSTARSSASSARARATRRSSRRSSRSRRRWASTRSPRGSSTRRRRRCCASSAARSRRATCSAHPERG